MKTLKIGIGITLLCSLFLCLNLEANALPLPLQQYTVNTTFYSSRIGSGGPFYAEPLSSGSPFPTFCLELQEHITRGTNTYWGTNNPYADMGGHDTDESTDGSDYLDGRTAKLYNYYLDNPGLNANHVAAIQLAIWRSEGEVSDSYIAQWGGSTGFSSDQINSLKADADNYYNNIGNWSVTNREIMVLNLYGEKNSPTYNPGIKYQSLLIPASVPEPGTLLFLGVGLISVVLIRRKTSK